MSEEIVLYFMTVIPILIFKLTLIWAGVNIVRMGYELLLRGISGDFKFQGDFHGVKADLVSASPGLLFAVLGITFLIAGVLVHTPLSIETTSHVKSDAAQQKDVPPQLQANPPGNQPGVNKK